MNVSGTIPFEKRKYYFQKKRCRHFKTKIICKCGKPLVGYKMARTDEENLDDDEMDDDEYDDDSDDNDFDDEMDDNNDDNNNMKDFFFLGGQNFEIKHMIIIIILLNIIL
ncbi:hypothetical protein Glove_267g67 [Diversispora epigaea]|uniref:Uncharacterized protein n=1 Tax=Diversispora epigaea TaxID=1348612 RepID=A0A397I795_9GLOM|nr:hypothetical protein Glove_267g67 [Diversispora epigaea]